MSEIELAILELEQAAREMLNTYEPAKVRFLVSLALGRLAQTLQHIDERLIKLENNEVTK